MTLSQFIAHFDRDDTVVLLEGKRDVMEADKEKLSALGSLLASQTQKMTFRSGNAEGADTFFSAGVAAIAPEKLEVVTPYTGHRKKQNLAHRTFSLDEIDIAAYPEVLRYSKGNKKTERLIEKYASGARDRFTIKAAYIIRDTVKVLGTQDIRPATFGIFYDDLSHPKTGGTGHTMRVCEQNQIPVIDQSVWFAWAEKA